MCLLHSRVRRVIYGCDDKNGGLKSHVHLHYVPKLNHHFRVFRGVLEEECRALWEERKDKDSLYFVSCSPCFCKYCWCRSALY